MWKENLTTVSVTHEGSVGKKELEDNICRALANQNA
jgi:hypothetical protein